MTDTSNKLKDKKSSNWAILWSYIRPDRKLFILTILIILFNIFVSIIAPFLLQNALSEIEKVNGVLSLVPPEVLYFGIGYGVVVFFSWWINAFQTLVTTKLSSLTVARLREDVYAKVLKNNMAFFNDLQIGQIVSKVASDSNELINIADKLAFIISSFLVLFGVVMLMTYYSVELTIYALLLLPIVFIIVFQVSKKVRKFSSLWRHQFGLVNASFNETFSSIQISKSFGREKDNIKRFVKINETTFEASKKRGFFIFLNPPIMDFFRHLIAIMILFGGTLAVQHQAITISTIFIFFVLLEYFYAPITRLANNYHQFQSGFANLDRMLSIIATDKDQEVFGVGISADNLNGKITFDKVTFAYLENNPVLKNISFEISPGEQIAIVGHTGAGKTTFISLLMRFYDLLPDKGCEGKILLDDVRIQDYELHSLRKSIALVSQNIFLFNGSIRDNLLLANPHASDEDVWKALNISNAYSFVSKLPGTLDYNIGERASRLSIGERQLLSIARAVLANPRILILDEATSSVDLFTESLIQEGLDTIMRNRTSIVIAHRLTTIVKSDRIMVIDKGQIVEVGKHEELLSKGRKYFEIYSTYFKHQSIDFLSGEIIV
jgi:ATP-binding cassette subfamily B protein